MRKPLLALTALVTFAGAGCTDSDDTKPGGDGSGSGSGSGDGNNAPPFTNGVSMLSGGAEAGYVDGARGAAKFANPVNAAFGPDGRVYVADFDNGKIRVVDAEDGTTSTVVALTGFQRPFGMAFAGDGTLYVSTDRDPQGQSGPMAGTIWRVDIAGRTATPLAARIGRPRGIVVLPDGMIAEADYMHHVIQLVDPRSGAVTPLAGTWDAKGFADGGGGAAKFSMPYGMVFVNDALIVADFENNRLRRVGRDGTVSTFAGTGTAGFADGALTSAKLNKPQGLAAASNGDIYLTDSENFRVRRIHGGSIETIAGSGTAGYVDNDDRQKSQFFGLEGLAVEPDGATVFVADGSRGETVPYHRIRSIKMN
jgi:sugar lactone lactonase YvrE